MKRSLAAAEMPAGAAPAKTVGEAAYFRIREDILSGAFAPGEPLRFKALAARYGMGISPLREALSRLAAERLVIGDGQRGFRNAEASPAAMWDIIRTRQLIEGQALVESIGRGDDAWEAALIAAFHRLARAPVPGREPAAKAAWDARHRDFHRALIAACPSAWLLHLADQLYLQSERYRRLRLIAHPAPRLSRNVDREHRALLDAALARDAKAAKRLFDDHLARTGRQVETLANDGKAAA